MLILGFNFAIKSNQVYCSRSQGGAQFLCPVNEVNFDEGSASVVYNKQANSERVYPFLSSRDSSLSVRNWVYRQETRKCINNQEAMMVPGTSWLMRSFVINMDCAEPDTLVLPFFQWYFISVSRLRFIVLARQAINIECTYPVKHDRPVVESFCINVNFWRAHVSTYFADVARSKTG